MPSLEQALPSSRGLQIAIVGGGIGGLMLAIALQRAGANFHIYEAASCFTEIGAGVGLARNAQEAMGLIDPRLTEIHDRIATRSTEADEKKVYRVHLGMEGRVGTQTEGLPAGYAVTYPRNPNMQPSILHRSQFLDALVSLIPDGVASFGKRLRHLDQSESRPRMFFADGSEAEADIVVGCDGIKSAVRLSLFGPESAARFSGKYAYRGLLPMSKAIEIVGNERACSGQTWFGYDGHLLTTPINGGKAMNVVAFRTKPDGKWENEKWVVPTHKDEMVRDFAGWGPHVLGILELLERTDKWALFEDPPLETFCVNNACVLGDAAHATTPHQGSGAAMAIEDAYILGLLLGMVKDRSQISAAFAAYDATRLERGQKVVRTSREAGEMYEFQDPALGDDLQAVSNNFGGRMAWIHEEDLAAQGQKARELFEQADPTK